MQITRYNDKVSKGEDKFISVLVEFYFYILILKVYKI